MTIETGIGQQVQHCIIRQKCINERLGNGWYTRISPRPDELHSHQKDDKKIKYSFPEFHKTHILLIS